MMVMRNSVFGMHESLLSGVKMLKGAEYKYLNSIFQSSPDELQLAKAIL